MVVQPVFMHPEPSYPTKSILDEHPEILRLVPCRWRANPVVLAALTCVVVIGSGCSSASYGCVAVTPPTHSSEPEAHSKAVQEARKLGIPTKQDNDKTRSKKQVGPHRKAHAKTEALQNKSHREQVFHFIQWLKSQDII